MMILAQTLLFIWLLTRLLPRRMNWLAAMLGICALIPWGDGLSLAVALRAFWGDPSITTIQCLVLSLAGRLPAALGSHWRPPGLIAGIGIFLYALALGPGDFDPYRLGFQPILLLTLLAVPALILWQRGQTLWLWLLGFDLLGFAAGILESTNLWDYLIDPLLTIACIVLAVRNFLANMQKTASS